MKPMIASLTLGMAALVSAGCCCHKGKGYGACPPSFGPGGCPPVVQPGLYGAADPVHAVPAATVAVPPPIAYTAPPARTAYVPLNSLPTY